MTAKERLVEDLALIFNRHRIPETLGIIADFIIEDRKRIVEPLVKLKEQYPSTGWPEKHIDDAIDQTIKNALGDA